MNIRHSFNGHLAYFNSRPRPTEVGTTSVGAGGQRWAVAIAPQTGSGALPVATDLARYLQAHAAPADPPWQVFDRGLIAKVLEDHHLPIRLAKFLPEDAHSTLEDMLDELLGLHPSSWVIAQQTIETIRRLVQVGNVILVGWGANAVAREAANVLHVRLVASLESRVARIQARERLSRKEALAYIGRSDRGRARYMKHYFHRQVSDVLLYGLVINTDQFSDAEVVRIIGDAMLRRQQSRQDTARAPVGAGHAWGE